MIEFAIDYDLFELPGPERFRPSCDVWTQDSYPARVISGGQTGADSGGLIAAARLGISTGGTAPLGWLREDAGGRESNAETMLRPWGLSECDRIGYPARNLRNIRDADLTLIVIRGRWTSGSRLTRDLCDQDRVPLLAVDLAHAERDEPGNILWLAYELAHKKPATLNVAGTRETRAPGITLATDRFLYRVFWLLRFARFLVEGGNGDGS